MVICFLYTKAFSASSQFIYVPEAAQGIINARRHDVMYPA